MSIIFRSSNERVFDKDNILVAIYELLRHTNENNIEFYQKQNLSDDGYLSDDTLKVDQEHLKDLKKERRIISNLLSRRTRTCKAANFIVLPTLTQMREKRSKGKLR